MNKENIRIAKLSGKGIYKRCRKEKHVYLQGVGKNDVEALQDLKNKIKNELIKFKVEKIDKNSNKINVNFNENVIVFDAERNFNDGYSTITQPLMPEWSQLEHNVVFVESKQLINL